MAALTGAWPALHILPAAEALLPPDLAWFAFWARAGHSVPGLGEDEPGAGGPRGPRHRCL